MPAALSNDCNVAVGPPVATSPLDARKFRALFLSNQLRVLLVSDNESERAAASLTVTVGSNSDPEELPGLAHFLEHMLFLGTAKYPQEDSYNAFLSQNGGNSNAMTMGECTNFHFDMYVPDRDPDSPNPRFREALDRFAQFFTEPLFTESATDRELNAVDSEHQKNLQNDGIRLSQLRKSCANPLHPYYKFSTGSKQTLCEIPQASNIDTRTQLLRFYHQNYSSNLMNLCVTAPFPLDVLQNWVIELFSDIPNHQLDNPCEQYRHISPRLPEHTGLMYHFRTICDIRTLELSWIVPSYIPNYRSKPSFIVSAVLADESKGSLLSLLKEKGWCESLHVYASDSLTFGMIAMHVELTETGIKFVDDIISIIFQCIRLVRTNGIPRRIFDEEAGIADINFRFKEREEPMSFSTETSLQMHHFEPQDYISGPALLKTYDPEKIKEVLDLLTIEDCVIIVGGKFPDETFDLKESWYGTEYRVEQIDHAKAKRWSKEEIHNALSIPMPNPFISSDFSLISEPLPDGTQDWEGPCLILSNEHLDLYHKVDRTFKLPQTFVGIKIWTPHAYVTPLNSVLMSIWTYLLEDSLKEYLYPAERAGFVYSITKTQTGFELNAQGYSDRIDVLLSAILDKIGAFIAKEPDFVIQKDRILRAFLNLKMDQPFQKAMYNRSVLLDSSRWHIDDYIESFYQGEVTLTAFNKFAQDVLKRMWICGIVHGNASENAAKELFLVVQKKLAYSPLRMSEMPISRTVLAPPGRDVYVREVHSNADDNNSAIEVYYQMFPSGDFAKDVCLELLSEILNKPAFHELRTVQQLGYMIFLGLQDVERFSGLFVIIQSTVADPDVLLERIDNFLQDVRVSMLEEMTAEVLQDFVSALVASKAEPEQTLRSRTNRFAAEIKSGFMCFDRNQREIEALKVLKKDDVLEMFDEFLAKDGKGVRRIVSQVYGNQHPFASRKELPKNAMEVKDHVQFRRTHPLSAAIGNPGGRRFVPQEHST